MFHHFCLYSSWTITSIRGCAIGFQLCWGSNFLPFTLPDIFEYSRSSPYYTTTLEIGDLNINAHIPGYHVVHRIRYQGKIFPIDVSRIRRNSEALNLRLKKSSWNDDLVEHTTRGRGNSMRCGRLFHPLRSRSFVDASIEGSERLLDV